MRKGQKSRIRASRTDIAVQVIVYMIVIAVCLIIILPCLNVLVLAFNDGKDAARGGIWFWPRVPTFDNIKEVFKDGSIVRAYGYTIARTVIGTVLSLTVTTLAAFSLKQKDLPGNKLITMLITFTMLFSGGMIPTYIQYKNLHLLNSFWVYVVPSLVSVTYLLMARTFFEGIPDSLEESAKLDGCGSLRILIYLIVPLAKPALVSCVIFQSLWSWNDYFNPLIYINSTKKFPISLGLRLMLDSAGKNAWDQIMAMSVVAILPCLILFAIAQKTFVEGVSTAGLKG